MCGISKPGITLIEVLVAIALIALLATMFVPNIRKNYRHERELFFRQLSALTQFAKNNALLKAKTHRIDFDLENRSVNLTIKSPEKEATMEPFVPVRRSFIATSLSIPKQIQFQSFYIGKNDEMERFKERGVVEKIWFFVTKEGVAQDVLINIIDLEEKKIGNRGEFNLQLNPFSAKFIQDDSFKMR